jgi:hypothetical protein
MKRPNLNRTFGWRRTLYDLIIVSLKRALRLIGDESELSNSQFSRKGLSGAFLTYDEPRKRDAQLAIMEIHKTEAIQIMREQSRRV